LHVVYDGEEALDYLEGKGQFSDRQQHPVPGLMLLDLNLPKKPGLEVLSWVREQPEFFTMPVIVLSASNQEVDVHRAYALGANAYLVKPTDVEKLADMMRTFRAFWLEQNTGPPECGKLKESQLGNLPMPGRIKDQSTSQR
jgi:CheY-like chemotaxis protein